MSIKEFYEAIGSDYSKVLRTLMNDRFADRMVCTFPKDQTMVSLRAAVEAKDIEASFKSCHALKGVTGNLGFYRLYDAVCALTEQLRPRTETADPALLENVEKEYEFVMTTLEKYIALK